MKFFSDFLNEDWSDRPAGPRIYLGAFGKHPGWNDHFDVGLETESLVVAKQIVYQQGIRAEIESQTWEKLAEADRLPGFDHWFLWLRPRECLLGYLWSSRDGKGRSLYPLTLCAHIVDLPISWVWTSVVPAFEYLFAALKAASTSGRVVSTVAEALDGLRAQHPEAAAREAAGFVGTAGLASLAEVLRGDSMMLYPVYHDIVERLSPFAPGALNFKSVSHSPRAQALRLPAINGSVAETINAWSGFLMSELDPGMPLLAIMPTGGTWADFIVGQPTGGDLFRIRAGTKHVPFATDQSRKPTPRLEPIVTQKLAELETAHLPQTSVFNGQSSLRNLADAVARLEGARGSGKGLFWRLFGASKPRSFHVFAGD
ncbi:MAG: hypothetical protein QM790_19885 [Nibricoccus sp.]